MDELMGTIAAALPQNILIGVVIGVLVCVMRVSKPDAIFTRIFLGLILGFILGCIFNINRVFVVALAVGESSGVGGGQTISYGLSPAEMRILIQYLLFWGGVGVALVLLWSEPGALGNGFYYGSVAGIISGVTVPAILYLGGIELEGSYHLLINVAVVIMLLLIASIQLFGRRAR